MGYTIEVKAQSIHPNKYGQKNFIEIFEETKKISHAGGKTTLLNLLNIDISHFERLQFMDNNIKQQRNCHEINDKLSVSIKNLTASKYTIYVNPYRNFDQYVYIYIYYSSDLLREIREGVIDNQLEKGTGKSNKVTYAIRRPIPVWRWRYDTIVEWIGDGEAPLYL